MRTVDLTKLMRKTDKSMLLKVDIEGDEAELIPALAPYLPEKCAIFFENHHGEEGWHKLSPVLGAVGFEMKELYRENRFINGFALRH